ncbi:hypothetical protein B0173_01204 [Mycobacterium avium subsp. paratuberculosis]|nr:hypothetical protein B0173_01204 [Mycobacterium avium subsp. paratuberculosis]
MASSEAREGAATPAPDAPSATHTPAAPIGPGAPSGTRGGVGGWIPGAAADRGHGAAVIRRRVDLAAGQCFT